MAGTEQDRALRSVAKVAIELTARDIYPAGEEQAEQLALVIGQVFNKPVPDGLLDEHTTMLDALHAGIAGQLAVLDDATLTDRHQSSAEVLGGPRTVLADTLTAQMNHDETHLQGRRPRDAVRQIGTAVQEALQRLDTRATFLVALVDTDVALHGGAAERP